MKREPSIIVKFNTNTLKNQLEVIAKHITALKEELEELELNSCPECGSKLTKRILFKGSEEFAQTENCENCGWKQ